MGLMRYNYRSEALSLCVDITITYPSGLFTYNNGDDSRLRTGGNSRRPVEKKLPYKEGMKFQTVYMLHGGSDDDTTMIRNTNLERYAERNCVMTVTAQVKDSFFMDTQYGYNYFTFVTEELPAVIRTLFASSPEREDNFIIGMAMGGNAALALAFKRPDLYKAAVDLSGGIGCSIDTDFFIDKLSAPGRLKRLNATFGDPALIRDGEYDIGYYARKYADEKEKIPQLFVSVGAEDYVRDTVRKDRDALRKLGYDIHYEEAEGLGHEWDYWDMYIKKALDEWLPLKRAPIYPEE